MFRMINISHLLICSIEFDVQLYGLKNVYFLSNQAIEVLVRIQRVCFAHY